MGSHLPPELGVQHAPPIRQRPTARSRSATVGAFLFGPAHGPGIEAPGAAVTDTTRERGLMRSTENRANLTTLAADAATDVTPAPFDGPRLPMFAMPGKDSTTGPAAKGSRDVKGVRPPVKRRRRMFRRWGSGQ